MKELTYKSIFLIRVSELLNSCDDVLAVQPVLQAIYKDIHKETPLVKAIDVKLVESKYLFNYFYQIEPTSVYAIQVEHFDYKAFLWIERDEWCLDDGYFSIDRIAKELAKAEMFGRIPENVKELYQLLMDEYWSFKPVQFPVFDGLEPKDMDEVLSYDSNYVLAGKVLENIEVITRQDWDRLCDNEKHWFE